MQEVQYIKRAMTKKRTLLLTLFILAVEILSMLFKTEPSRSASEFSYYAEDLSYPLVIAHQGGTGFGRATRWLPFSRPLIWALMPLK